jgi:hypothetical protein
MSVKNRQRLTKIEGALTPKQAVVLFLYPFGQTRLAEPRGNWDDPRVERSAGWMRGGIDGRGW